MKFLKLKKTKESKKERTFKKQIEILNHYKDELVGIAAKAEIFEDITLYDHSINDLFELDSLISFLNEAKSNKNIIIVPDKIMRCINLEIRSLNETEISSNNKKHLKKIRKAHIQFKAYIRNIRKSTTLNSNNETENEFENESNKTFINEEKRKHLTQDLSANNIEENESVKSLDEVIKILEDEIRKMK